MEPMINIPKKLHLYWGGSKMSQTQTLTVQTFHKLNPDWEINVYVPKQEYLGDLKYIPDYTGEDFFPMVRKMDYVNIRVVDLDDHDISHDLHNILRSDILRYHILYEQGGVWSDFDIIWLKPMDHFYNIKYVGDVPMADISGIVCFNGGTGGWHSIGVMVHCKKDDYILSLIEQTESIKPPYKHQSFGAVMINAMYPNFASLKKFPNIIGALFKTYYPFGVPDLQPLYTKTELDRIADDVMCVHWYNGHSLSKEYINKKMFDSGRPCSMTEILKRVCNG